MLEFYCDPCTVDSRKVLTGLDILGTKYHLKKIDYFSQQHKSPEFLKINPHGTVPAAVDGELKISQSNAILQFAADDSGSMYPRHAKQRCEFNRWLLWEASIWFPSCYIYLLEYVVKPLLQAEPDQSVIDAEAPKWNKHAAILNEQLSKTKWLCGDNLTIADIAVAAPMHLHATQRLPLDQCPHLTRWLTEQVEKLPEWQRTQAAVDNALLPGKAAEASTSGTLNANLAYTKDVDSTPNSSTRLMQPRIFMSLGTTTTVTNGWYRAA